MKYIINTNNTKNIPNNLNLSHLLNLIDGVVEMHGRILIMATKHIEKIDKALIRPGRVDLKIEFNYVTGDAIKTVIGDYIKNIDYNSESWVNIDFESIVISPAELINTIMKSVIHGDDSETQLVNLLKQFLNLKTLLD